MVAGACFAAVSLVSGGKEGAGLGAKTDRKKRRRTAGEALEIKKKASAVITAGLERSATEPVRRSQTRERLLSLMLSVTEDQDLLA